MKSSILPAESLLILGPTGSGKTPLGNQMETSGLHGRRCLHFDFGDALRTLACSEGIPSGFRKKDISFIRDVLKNGVLLENETFILAEKILLHFLSEKNFRKGDLLVLNGLPRHRDQAKDMTSIADIKGVIVLECTPDVVLERIQQNTGGDRAGRTDDDRAMIRSKMETFRNRTIPLTRHYVDYGIPLLAITVTASATAEQLFGDIMAQQVLPDPESLV